MISAERPSVSLPNNIADGCARSIDQGACVAEVSTATTCRPAARAAATAPPASASMDVGATTMDEIQELMADPRYGQDMAYTSRVEKKVYALHGESF